MEKLQQIKKLFNKLFNEYVFRYNIAKEIFVRKKKTIIDIHM